MVARLGTQHAPEIAELLAESFREDPAFVALFAEVPPGRASSYRTFMRIWARSAFRLGHSVFGIRDAGTLAGVVAVTPPGPQRQPISLRDLPLLPSLLLGMRLDVGVELAKAVRRPREVPRATPEISMLAVSPAHQGRGMAKELLQAAHTALAAGSDNKQVYLYTTALGSRKFYEKQGYRLVAATQAAGADVYHMVLTLPTTQGSSPCLSTL